MKHYWLYKHNKQKLIIFFCGWGNDYAPFRRITANDFDVLFLYDYSDIEAEISIPVIMQEYSETHLLAWSLGVVVANIVCKDYTFNSSLAINGTIKAIDEQFGISPANYSGTLANLDERNRDKFFRRMCLQKDVIQFYNENAPQRELINQKEELAALQILIEQTNLNHCVFTKAIACHDDAIFPFPNQLAFWHGVVGKTNVIELQAPHFPFLMFNDFKDILDSGHRS